LSASFVVDNGGSGKYRFSWMASTDQGGSTDEWRLGIDPTREPAPAPAAAGSAHDLSRHRLARPVHVLTIEHLGWVIVAAWALLTRLLFLGARPLASGEAMHALFEYDLANRTGEAASAGYHPAWAGWVHLVEAGVFAAGGADDYGARILFALGGLLMVAMAFEMRHYIGRAGAISLGMMLAVSPTIGYFSRASSPIELSCACALAALAIYMAMIHQPTIQRAAGLGAVGGLMIAAHPTGLVTAIIFMIALAMIGIWGLFTLDHAYLRTRVWLDRYASMAVAALIAAALVWALSELALFEGVPLLGIRDSIRPLWSVAPASSYLVGLDFYAPGLALYDFMIMLAALTGIVVIIGLRVRSRFAAFCLLWLAMSFGYYLWTPARSSDRLLWMLVPGAFVGAIAIDYIHHTHSWPAIRIVLAALAAITIYAQVLSLFVHYGPDASEPPWARSANLYWDGATTIQAAHRLSEIRRHLSPGDESAYLAGEWPPAMRWYLRTLRPSANPDAATVYVDMKPPPIPADLPHTFQFDFEQSWHPNIGDAGFVSVLRFVFTARIWGPVESRAVSVTLRPPSGSAPTLILPPSASQ